jgi:iron(III) transport system ATP-binding protein
MTDSVLQLEDVSKRFGSEQALRDLSMTLRDDEILTLIGPSGCGKTTALRVIAGLERPDNGRVQLRGRTVNDEGTFVPPEQRSVGFVFQDLALFPHLTVEENVAFGLTDSQTNRQERLDETLDLVGLQEYRSEYPKHLSGGQKQRVALARSLVIRPSVLLMDEPFSNLDKELRNQLRRDVRHILRESGTPTIFVTHHQEEAIFLGDRTAVMCEGSIEQVGQPEDVVVSPDCRFVAEFLGPTEFLPTRRTDGGYETEVQTLSPDMVDPPDKDSFDLMVRADDINIAPASNGDADGVVEDAEFLGGLFRYKVRLESGRRIFSLLNHSERIAPDTPVNVQVEPGHKLVGFESDEKCTCEDDPAMNTGASDCSTID